MAALSGLGSSLANFQFSNPANPYQQNFNKLMAAGDPNQAYNYLENQGSNGGQSNSQLVQALGSNFNNTDYNNMINGYSGGGQNLGSYNPSTLWSSVGGMASTNPMQAAKAYAAANGGGFNAFGMGGASGAGSAGPSQMGGSAANPGSGSGTASNGGTSPVDGIQTGANGIGTAAYSAKASDPTNFGQPMTNPSAYLDPSMAWQEQQGQNALQNSAAARGGLLSGQTLKDLTGYSQGLASTNWQQAEQDAMANQQQLYGVANNDRNFAYNAQVGDRAFNAQNNQFLAQMGLQGTNASSQLSQYLAGLLSQNSIAAGQAQGAGTVGAAGQLTGGLGSIGNQLTQNNNPMTAYIQGLLALQQQQQSLANGGTGGT